MDEVLGMVGQIVVDDVRDVLHIDAARSNIGRHQHLESASVEAGERARSLRLGAIAVNHGRGETVAHQALRQPLGAALGARKHQGRPFSA